MVRRLLTGVFQTAVRYTAAVIFLGLLWQAGTTAFGDAVLPSPWATGKLFLTSLTEPVYLTHLGISTLRLAVGMTIAAAAAFLLGLWLGHVRLADKLGAPLIFITYPLPKIVLLPVFFLLLGLGESSRILLIALTTGYQMLVIVRASAKALWEETSARWCGTSIFRRRCRTSSRASKWRAARGWRFSFSRRALRRIRGWGTSSWMLGGWGIPFRCLTAYSAWGHWDSRFTRPSGVRNNCAARGGAAPERARLR